MKILTIDRFEGVYAICEDKDGAKFAIPAQEIPQGAKEGTYLKISDDGTLSVDSELTEKNRKSNFSKQNNLFS